MGALITFRISFGQHVMTFDGCLYELIFI